MTDYRIEPVEVAGFADADGVVVNPSGEWLGEYDAETEQVMPYSEDGDYIPAPANWRERITAEL